MDKDRIVSAISIELGLSKAQSEKAVNSMFYYLLQYLMNNKILEIRKFGKFKLITDKNGEGAAVKFTPAKKLSARVNGNFENLKKVKVRSGHLKYNEYKPVTATIDKEGKEIIAGDDKEVKEVRKNLISDDLIKLHEEIVREKDKENSDTNLWG